MITATLFTMTDPRPNDQRPWLAGMGAAWLMIGAVAVGIAGGLAIDRWLGSAPWGVMVSSLAFLAAGVYLVIREGSR